MEPTKIPDPEGTEITRRVPHRSADISPEIPGYQILEKLGEGGMGAVYKARQLRLDRTVAIKILHPGPGGQNPIRNFQAESRLMASLSDHHIVGIYDCGEVGGLYYLVMEYVGGPNLRSLMKPGHPWPVARAAKILDTIARAVTRIHGERVLHLDIKPENILCTPDGAFKISDFGIARGPGDSQKVVELGYIQGTLNYAAPEQRFGLPTDERSDLYALGVLAYELLTGELPTVTHDPPSSHNPKVPKEADEVLRRALARHPEQRYASVAEFRRELARALVTRRGVPAWAAVLAGVAAILALLITVVWLLRKEPSPPTPAPLAVVSIVTKEGVRRIETAAYQAQVEDDGCLTSLRSGGVEFFYSGGPIARGAYFFDPQLDELVPLPTIAQASDRSLTARGDRASVRYDFDAEQLSLTLKNDCNHTLFFFIVFDLGVKAVGQDEENLFNVPQLRSWPNTVWYAGSSKLKINGGTTIWGMWEGNHQVWQANLESQETRRVQFVPGAATGAEQARLIRVAGKVIKTSKYSARVEPDGCLTSFRSGGAEFLRADFGFARGAYLFQGDVLSLPEVERSEPRSVAMRSKQAVIRYDGDNESLRCTVTNLTDQPISFYFVFHADVKAVVNDQGEWSKTPTIKDWANTTWFTGKAKLKITGGIKIWGPWEQNTQVCEAVIPARESRLVVLTPGLISAAEAAEVAKVTAR